MLWQDFVFLFGSMFGVLTLIPTLRNSIACVPRSTSLPSMVIGAIYAMTFLSLGMYFSALGAFVACTMWSLILYYRAPDRPRDKIARGQPNIEPSAPSAD